MAENQSTGTPTFRVRIVLGIALAALSLPGLAPLLGAADIVRSVEYVEFNAGGAGASLSRGQIMANCVPFVTMAFDSNPTGVFSATLPDVYLSTVSSLIYVNAGRTNSGATLRVGVTVVEFDPAYVRVQSGSFTLGSTSTTATISAVNTARTAMVFYHQVSDGLSSWSDVSVAGSITSSTQITFQRDSAGFNISSGHYYVFESLAGDFTVQQATLSIAGGATTGTQTLSTAVATDRSFVIGSYRTPLSGQDASAGSVVAYLSSGTQVTAERYSASATAISAIPVFVVSLRNTGRVQRGSFVYSSGSTQTTIQKVQMDRAMAWGGMTAPGPANAITSATASNLRGIGTHKLKLTNATTIYGERGFSGAATTGRWEVVEWARGTTMVVKSGLYTGTGTDNRSIPIGFRPDVLFIKAETARYAVMRTATMAPDDTKSMNPGGEQPFSDGIQSFDAAGFTVGTDARVNNSGTVYHWVAFRGASEQMQFGKYTGDGSPGRNVTGLGFKPDYVIALSAAASDAGHEPVSYSSTMTLGTGSWNFGNGNDASNWITGFVADGFVLGNATQVNSFGGSYHYVAWKATPGRVSVGRYTGNGTPGTVHDAVGFRPEWVLVKDDTTSGRWIHKSASTGPATDKYLVFEAFSSGTDEVRKLLPLGFELGSGWAASNSNLRTYHYIAFGPSQTTPLVKTGSYVGNGVDNRVISELGFQPDVVIVDEQATGYAAMISSSDRAGYSKAMDGGSVADATGYIKAMAFDSFTVGTQNPVNANGKTYHWVAFDAAPGFVKVGNYTGTGTTAKTVSGVGFRPAYLMIWSRTNAGPVVHWNQSSMWWPRDFLGNTSPGPTSVAVGNDSFTVSENDATVNANGVVYEYVAWAEVAGATATGSYQATSSTRQLAAGFMPEYVIVSSYTYTRNAVHKPASLGAGSTSALVFGVTGPTATIGPMDANGFTVVADANCYTNGCSGGTNVYNWVAFGPHVTSPTYRSIGSKADYYDTSTIAVTKGSTAVSSASSAVGTTWRSDNRGRGDVIVIPCPDASCTGGVPYTIAAVVDNQTLVLTQPYLGDTASGVRYKIRRHSATPAAWENCVDGGPCLYAALTPASSSLVADDRVEVGIVYEDSVYTGSGGSPILTISGSTTDATHTITLTADGANRHYGVPGQGVVFDNGTNQSKEAILVSDHHVTVEWLEIKNGACSGTSWCPEGIRVEGQTATDSLVSLRYNLIHDLPAATSLGHGIEVNASVASVDIMNNVIYNTGGDGVRLNPVTPSTNWSTAAKIRIVGNTVAPNGYSGAVGTQASFYAAPPPASTLVSNNIGYNARGTEFQLTTTVLDPASSNNLSNDTSATSHSPGGGAVPSQVPLFVDSANGNYHLASGSPGIDAGADLSAIASYGDIDGQLRISSAWDVGADEYDGFTAVGLASFTAVGLDASASVEWETAQELDNLGFHLFRGPSADGPWTRLNATLIPGLGSSPEGKQYEYLDSGLANGTTYFYRLEDMDRRGRLTSHGPVSATPNVGVQPGGGEGGGGGGGGEGGGPGEPPPSPKVTPRASWKPHGEPETQSLRVVERSSSGVTLELVTGGFYSEEQPDGTTRLIVPGFFDHDEPGRPSVPTRRLWQSAVVGRGVELVSVEPSELEAFSSLRVPVAGKPVAVSTESGTYEAASLPVSRNEARRARARDAAANGTVFPAPFARVHQTAFQGERKMAYVELIPLRVDEVSGRVTLARRLLVRLAFTGKVPGEEGRSDQGRRAPDSVLGADAAGTILARFATISRGLHSVAFEEIPALSNPVPVSSLRLSRLGVAVPFHVEPRSASFGPGSVLYFLSDGTASAYANEAVYELAAAPGGITMTVDVAASRRIGTAPSLSYLRTSASFETNFNYLPSLTEARDLWLWDYGLSVGQGASYAFALDAPLLDPETARLKIDLQGGSDSLVENEHHVLAFLNGSLVGDLRFDGMVPATLTLDVSTSLLQTGSNTLRLENAGDTGSIASFVYLDRFSVEYPRAISQQGGILEGIASQSGRASLEAAPGTVLLDTSSTVPRFLGRALGLGRLAWNAEASHRYLAVFPDRVKKPQVRSAPSGALRAAANQADWIVIAPEPLLSAAQTLATHRETQGLTTMAVSLEDVTSEFGFGEHGPHAVSSFLAFAFHRWTAPSPRYVLLLGDASYDPKGHLTGTSRPDLVPTPFSKSSYLWTPADPLFAAVNGSDAIPDIAIGRINAANLTEADAAVRKILDFENAGLRLDGNAALVADNPDLAGDFEQNQDDIATLLPSRPVQKIYLTQLGASGAKTAVRNAFDTGASLISYVGHGSSGLWATEGILRSPDVASFAPQPIQPLVLTMTCSNGYFVSPYNNSLSERLVLAEQKGAIASFSPSGLSLDAAAHVFHRAVVSELEQGSHERLGDLLLAAQASYAASGAFPELLDFYNLLGDPGLKIQ